MHGTAYLSRCKLTGRKYAINYFATHTQAIHSLSVNGRGYTDAYHWPGRSPFEVVLKFFPPCIRTRFISEYLKSSL